MKNLQQDVNLLFYQIESRIGSLVEHNKMAATSSSRLRRLPLSHSRVNNTSARAVVSLYRVWFHTQKQSMTLALAHPATYKQQCYSFPVLLLLFRIRNVNKPWQGTQNCLHLQVCMPLSLSQWSVWNQSKQTLILGMKAGRWSKNFGVTPSSARRKTRPSRFPATSLTDFIKPWLTSRRRKSRGRTRDWVSPTLFTRIPQCLTENCSYRRVHAITSLL